MLKRLTGLVYLFCFQCCFSTTIEKNLVHFANAHLGKPYLSDALGEGRIGRFSQRPRFRLDAFDCQSYVETVMAQALALLKNQSPQYVIDRLRYGNEHPAFENRHHFFSPQWLGSNGRYLDALQDNLAQIQSLNLGRIAETYIKPKAWYYHLTTKQLHLNPPLTGLAAQMRLNQLRRLGDSQPNMILDRLPYLDIDTLLEMKESTFANYLPQITLVVFVRPNWDLLERLGTHLNVSHVGWLIKEQQKLWLYHASETGNVTKIRLWDYLKRFEQHPTLKGIALYGIKPA